MSIELKVPEVGESVTEVEIGRWLKQVGDFVKQDEDLVQLETDKASMDLPAPEDGVLTEILKAQGESVGVGDVIALLDSDAKATSKKEASKETSSKETAKKPSKKSSKKSATSKKQSDKQPAKTKQSKERADGSKEPTLQFDALESPAEAEESIDVFATPSARRALRKHGLTLSDVKQLGQRIDEGDVLRYVEQQQATGGQSPSLTSEPSLTADDSASQPSERSEEAVPMSLIRRRIAERLVSAQQNAALLTTFNEIDMSAVKSLRTNNQERFQKAHGVKLGFMSFFVKATVDALKQTPGLNAEIRDKQFVYRNYYDVCIAIGSDKGLVTPVLRDADQLSFADVEKAIDRFAKRAAANELAPQDLQGGTFTITNGGIYGSLLSTPIVNPPQSGVLGMHGIQDRPVVRDGEIVIRPMMYVALTYDHRIVDGREAVTFLKSIKDDIETPARMLLE